MLPITPLQPGCAQPASPTATRWHINHSQGLDALAFLGPLSGKPFYARFYADELRSFEPRLSAEARQALAALTTDADTRGQLLWPWLALVVSGAGTDTIDDLLLSLDQADTRLRPPLQASPYWDADDWQHFLAARPALQTVLLGLQRAGFATFHASGLDSGNPQRAAAVLAPLDIVAAQQRLLARTLPTEIRITLLRFCKPHGVKVQGPHFLAHVDSPPAVLVLTAAHELLHPPIDMQGDTAHGLLAELGRDPLLARIVAEKPRDSGYNSLEGLVEEDIVQALDQIIQEGVGFGRPPAQRWTQADDGIHVLAAALYGLLKADGLHRAGAIEPWLQDAVRRGRLAPGAWHAAAATVLQRPADRLWPRP